MYLQYHSTVRPLKGQFVNEKFPFLTLWELVRLAFCLVNPKLQEKLWRCRLLIPVRTTRRNSSDLKTTFQHQFVLSPRVAILPSAITETRQCEDSGGYPHRTPEPHGRRSAAAGVQSHFSQSSAAARRLLLFSFQQRRQRTSCVMFCAFRRQWFTFCFFFL